jgi:hypothetical protein
MIDSNGKPGTGGNANGVETELGAVYVITVVLTVVGVEVALDVVTGVEDVTLLTLLVLEVLEDVELVLVTVVVVTVVLAAVVVVTGAVVEPVTPPGGSR